MFSGNELLELIYDILAQNEVSQQDKDRVTKVLDHIDYDHSKIVIDNMDLRLYDHEEDA